LGDIFVAPPDIFVTPSLNLSGLQGIKCLTYVYTAFTAFVGWDDNDVDMTGLLQRLYPPLDRPLALPIELLEVLVLLIGAPARITARGNLAV